MAEGTDVIKFAVKRLHLPSGVVLNNQVVEQHCHGLMYYDLVEELPFVEWRGGDFYL